VNNRMLHTAAWVLLAFAPAWAGITVGQKLPEVEVAEKGVMVPSTKVENGRMVMDGKEIAYRPWKATDHLGRIRTLYHLAGRLGIDDINKAYIDALIAAKLPEGLPDGAYKTITILNLADAMWGTHGLGISTLEKNQRKTPFALFVADEKGAARAAWGLQLKQSAVIILDRDNTVLFFKEGKLTPEEIAKAVGIIQDKLK
jgi:uncharacterized protein